MISHQNTETHFRYAIHVGTGKAFFCSVNNLNLLLKKRIEKLKKRRLGLKERELKMNELYQKALEFWGKDLQLNMVFEELGELITKLSRVIRNRIPPTDLAEEIADVEIMLEQLTYIYKLEEQVQHTKAEKLLRLQKRLGIQEKILWYNNIECPQCGKLIEDPKKIRACETGYSYCSEGCAREHVKDIYQEE